MNLHIVRVAQFVMTWDVFDIVRNAQRFNHQRTKYHSGYIVDIVLIVLLCFDYLSSLLIEYSIYLWNFVGAIPQLSHRVHNTENTILIFLSFSLSFISTLSSPGIAKSTI